MQTESEEVRKSDSSNLLQIFKNGQDSIQNYRSCDIFSDIQNDELTDEQHRVIQLRIANQQKLFQIHQARENQRKKQEIQDLCPHLNSDEIEKALYYCHGDEIECAHKLVEDNGFQKRVRSTEQDEEYIKSKFRKQSNEESINGGIRTRTCDYGKPAPQAIVSVPASTQEKLYMGNFKGRLNSRQLAALSDLQTTTLVPVNTLQSVQQRRRGMSQRVADKRKPTETPCDTENLVDVSILTQQINGKVTCQLIIYVKNHAQQRKYCSQRALQSQQHRDPVNNATDQTSKAALHSSINCTENATNNKCDMQQQSLSKKSGTDQSIDQQATTNKSTVPIEVDLGSMQPVHDSIKLERDILIEQHKTDTNGSNQEKENDAKQNTTTCASSALLRCSARLQHKAEQQIQSHPNDSDVELDLLQFVSGPCLSIERKNHKSSADLQGTPRGRGRPRKRPTHLSEAPDINIKAEEEDLLDQPHPTVCKVSIPTHINPENSRKRPHKAMSPLDKPNRTLDDHPGYNAQAVRRSRRARKSVPVKVGDSSDEFDDSEEIGAGRARTVSSGIRVVNTPLGALRIATKCSGDRLANQVKGCDSGELSERDIKVEPCEEACDTAGQALGSQSANELPSGGQQECDYAGSPGLYHDTGLSGTIQCGVQQCDAKQNDAVNVFPSQGDCDVQWVKQLRSKRKRKSRTVSQYEVMQLSGVAQNKALGSSSANEVEQCPDKAAGVPNSRLVVDLGVGDDYHHQKLDNKPHLRRESNQSPRTNENEFNVKHGRAESDVEEAASGVPTTCSTRSKANYQSSVGNSSNLSTTEQISSALSTHGDSSATQVGLTHLQQENAQPGATLPLKPPPPIRTSAPSNAKTACPAPPPPIEDTLAHINNTYKRLPLTTPTTAHHPPSPTTTLSPPASPTTPPTPRHRSRHRNRAPAAAISTSGHTCRGRVKQKSHKRSVLINLGKVRYEHRWHDSGYIFPDGFHTRTVYRSSVQLDQVVVHDCMIQGEGGAFWPRPTFVVVAADMPDQPITAASCTGSWKRILQRIASVIERKRAEGEELPPPPKTAIAGPEYFGLNLEDIRSKIESLDTQQKCHLYWKGKAMRDAALGGGEVGGVAAKLGKPPRPGVTSGGDGGRTKQVANKHNAANNNYVSDSDHSQDEQEGCGVVQQQSTRRGRGRPKGSGNRTEEMTRDVCEYAGERGWAMVSRQDRYQARCQRLGSGGVEYDDDDNPLPGFIDPITLAPVVSPAISPFGHVMGLRTWKAVLGARGVCPFTKKMLSFEAIKKLTISNVEVYRESIDKLTANSGQSSANNQRKAAS